MLLFALRRDIRVCLSYTCVLVIGPLMLDKAWRMHLIAVRYGMGTTVR